MKSAGMFVLLAAGLLTGAASAGGEAPMTEKISGDRIIVIDGDTVALPCKAETGFKRQCTVKVRLKDIDTPETYHPTCERELVKGLEAKARLRELISGEAVTVRQSGETDRYGRSLGWLILQDGSDLGSILVQEGLALVWKSGSEAKSGRIAHWCGATQ